MERDEAGDNRIVRIIDPTGAFGESRIRGISLYAGVDSETNWAAFVLDVHATRTMPYKVFVLGEENPGGYVRDRANAVLQARRCNFHRELERLRARRLPEQQGDRSLQEVVRARHGVSVARTGDGGTAWDLIREIVHWRAPMPADASATYCPTEVQFRHSISS